MESQEINNLKETINILTKKINFYDNVFSILKFLNMNLEDENILSLINDVLLGIFGCEYISIYEIHNNELKLEEGNIIENFNNEELNERLNIIKNKKYKSFLLNSKKPIFISKDKSNSIHSIMGMPILLQKKILGFILLEHTKFNFFGLEDMSYINIIANQLAIVLENNRLYLRIRESATKDYLLNINNRKHFFDIIYDKIKENSNYIIAMLDVDNFKTINDTYGHQVGDMVLKNIACILRDNIDTGDICGRYGGEEMIIYLENNNDLSKSISKLDKIRTEVEKLKIIHKDNIIPVTVSIGGAISCKSTEDLEDIICRADMTLYKIKKTGKNRVVIN